MRSPSIAAAILLLLSIVGGSSGQQHGEEQIIAGIPAKVTYEHYGFGTRFVYLRLRRESYSRENLERIWRYYCEKYPDKKDKLDIRIFVDRPNLDSKAADALSYDANFNRQGEGAAALGGDNEFYSYRPDVDNPDRKENVQLTGRYPFLRDSYSGEPGIDFVLAARKGEVARLDALLEAGVDINVRNDKGETALIGACAAGRIEVAKLLLSKGANPNLTDKEGDTALTWATMTLATKTSKNHESDSKAIKLIGLLLDSGAALNVANESWPPLVVAAERGNTEVIRLLLEKGADINAKNWAGMSALSRAIYDGNLEAAKRLLAKGADIESRDRSGSTPLFLAVPQSLDLVRDLLARGADANARNYALETALMRASIDTVTELLSHRAEIDAQDKSGATALMHAIASRNFQKTSLLLENGAKVNIRNNSGGTALSIAKQYSNNSKIIELLLKFGATE